MLTVGGTSISLIALLQIVIALILVIIIGKIFKKIFKENILNKLNIDSANRETFANIISYFFGAILFILLLQYFGVNLSTLAVIGGGLGLGIGFGLQDITKNFISGLTLLFERPIKPGDFIEIENIKGYVTEISTRSTVVETQDGSEIFIPNSFFINHRFTNWSYNSFTARIIIPIAVAYQSDLVLVTELLLQSAYQESRVVAHPSPEVLLVGFGDSSLNLELRVWINPIDQEPEIRSNLNFIIEYLFRQYNITIPFPQRDVWLKNYSDVLENKNINISQEKNNQNHHHKSKKSIKDMLWEVDYFQDFNEIEIRKLIESGYRKNLEKEQILFKENEIGDTFYIILSGKVEVFVEKINKHLNYLKAGSFFGELSLMLGMPRTATVKAVEPTILFCINQANFRKLLMKNPELYDLIVNKLSERKNELVERQNELRRMGLIDKEEDDNNPLIWVRNRLKKLIT
ncbi:mechanosensitive ion channel domain-containing protein [Cyanobacterium aponinum UTEX 3222]|uniref:MscS Mechanosensitive ion channel n=1 Tax=Cyanobacterium aponinum (strain PCC 10605) TaxID=755178 RepID=K9Z4D0_CYAAP|nr:mechanosensitive ion channel domain-containing protein [Cyanobacterium aponinum]AFZ53445.1 MscS Mechanosensitive ion channel [Cyanobacterium aponinum PCC 10605]PHV61755.1 mechanosensitive ion channel protein MscS [Cyanobacterium aponinum IPPAS B-1201]WRL37836.1 mechanosensitive ion channel domain-containing protein [Cyanobacterium aponinum UTEX 3221]WRL41684.1 mechanosensitive ion channel domain-containing protein [Cyanobacterium aponinum UTEX 3222]